MADLAWDFAIKEGFRVFNSLSIAKPFAQHYSTWARQGPFLSRSYSTWTRPETVPVPEVPMIASISSLLGMAQGIYCKLARNLDVQWSFLISQPRRTPRPVLEKKVRPLPSYSSFTLLY